MQHLFFFNMLFYFSVFLSEGLYMEPGDVAENVNGGLSHMSEAKVTRTKVLKLRQLLR